MTSVEAWYKTLPAFTRSYMTVSIAVTGLVSFGLLDYGFLIFDWTLVYRSLHLWRFLTPFLFFGKFSFGFLIAMVILVQYCRPLETHPSFDGKYPEFVWCVLLLAIQLLLFSYYTNTYFLGHPMVFAIMYVWSRKDPDQSLSLWGFQFKSYQLPFVMMALHVLMGAQLLDDLIGVLAGHIYYFLADVVPLEYGYNFVQAPWVIKRLFTFKQATEYQAFSGRGFRAN